MICMATKRKDGSFNILSHLISFSLGVSVSLSTSSTTHCPMAQVEIQPNLSEVQNQNYANIQSQANSLEIKAPNTSIAFREMEKSFYHLGLEMSTDKVLGPTLLPKCLETGDCHYKNSQREECRPWGHWYHTLYQQSIGKYSLNSTSPFQFLEIGFHKGYSYEIYRSFFPQSAELHSVELTCAPKGKKSRRNFAIQNANYQKYRDEDRLHCGDASNVKFLNEIWTQKMNRPDAPPLKVVIDDGSHQAWHMAQSVFFWFPHIEPGGLMIVEDIQPLEKTNLFRTQFIPQLMADLHFCGDPAEKPDSPCFPLLQSLLQSIHCEMHICVFERNNKPAISNLTLSQSMLPENALNAMACGSIGSSWGIGLPPRYRAKFNQMLQST